MTMTISMVLFDIAEIMDEMTEGGKHTDIEKGIHAIIAALVEGLGAGAGALVIHHPHPHRFPHPPAAVTAIVTAIVTDRGHGLHAGELSAYTQNANAIRLTSNKSKHEHPHFMMIPHVYCYDSDFP